MERGRSRLTAEVKGKAVMTEHKEKTQDEKEAELALHVAYASDRQERGIGLQIRENTPSEPAPTTQTPMEDGSILRELASKVALSVVTVAAVMGDQDYTHYGTGFIITSQKNCALVFTWLPPEKEQVKEFLVYFEGNNVRHKAHVLVSDKSCSSNFLILIIQTNKEYASVVFSDEPLDRELVFTIGATGGIKLNANGKLSDESVGSVVTNRGKVPVSTYAATDLRFEHVHKSETFFELTCPVHDEIISLRNVDKKAVRPANIILCAPVFRFNGKVGGIVFSPGNWGGVKCGLHAKSVIAHIQRLCGKKKWQEQLKECANRWLVHKPSSIT